jgi:two-component system LytT family response regulator
MDKIIKCVLVDDEPAARRKLKRMLADYPALDIAGEAGDISTALAAIELHHPDVLFLDIKLSGENGFDLLNELVVPVHVVFITAHDEFAVAAFEVNALDYLLKPIHPDRLRQCISKMEGLLNIKSETDKPLLLKDAYGCLRKVCISQIALIKAEGDYTLVRSSLGDFLVRRTVKNWQQLLPESGFVKASRSTIINVDSVIAAGPVSADGVQTRLDGLSELVELSRTEWQRLKEFL